MYTLEHAIKQMELATTLQPTKLNGPLFTAQDVLAILRSIQTTVSIPDEWVDTFVDALTDINDESIIDYDNVQFDIDYSNRIVVSNVEIDKYQLRRAITENLNEAIADVNREIQYELDKHQEAEQDEEANKSPESDEQ
jgi:hypothetical protein